jgi:hypothetical protein
MLVESGYVDVGKTRLYYEEMGEGHPLIMLHGGFLDRLDALLWAFPVTWVLLVLVGALP